MCRFASRGNCRFKGNCWSVHASEGTPLLSGVPAAGAVAGGGGVVGAVGAPKTTYTLPAAGGAGHGGGVTAITIAVEKNWLISGSEDGSVLCWDLSTCTATAGPACSAAVTSLLYAEGWLFCGTQTGGITGHHTV
jgi:hypothetical protein